MRFYPGWWKEHSEFWAEADERFQDFIVEHPYVMAVLFGILFVLALMLGGHEW